ncbi:unnamed protein product [Hymenolepis diminuta]|uniref:Uncharacterized protein n=1 Tax=Hymenolepis diminuta TaxID=6216 RepID=A0A564Y2U9_HYMDI|nr:unnamed protein product [Hymenolepis diminuta]
MTRPFWIIYKKTQWPRKPALPRFRSVRLIQQVCVNFLPEYASGVFRVLESHFKLNNIRSQLSSNPYCGFKVAILQHTQTSAAVRVEKLLQEECLGDLRPTALLNRMKLLAPEESFDTDFWKLLYSKKLPSYI